MAPLKLGIPGDYTARDHLRKVIETVQENIGKLLDNIDEPQVKELAQALLELWNEYQSLLEHTDSGKTPTLSFFINNILTRYLFDLEYSAILCMAEAVDCISRTILEYWEQAIVLDYHERFRRWDPERRIRWLLGIALDYREKTKIREFKENKIYVDMLRDLLGNAITKKIRQLYLDLSGGVHGALQRERILESRLEQLMTLSCAEAKFEAKIITKDIKRVTKLLKLTKDVTKYLK